MRALCLHGHFYQPPREHPWLGVLEPEPSAAPHRDWNTRITAECYAPNAAARILDASGRLADLVDNYEWTSFNFGPTLLAWLAREAPDVPAALRRADAASQKRTGFGNAWAQAYSHPILPLSSARDIRTQVWWGRRDFEHRFGRAPEGMWLPRWRSPATLRRAQPKRTSRSPCSRRTRPTASVRRRPARQLADGRQNTFDTRRVYRAVPAPGSRGRCRVPRGRCRRSGVRGLGRRGAARGTRARRHQRRERRHDRDGRQRGETYGTITAWRDALAFAPSALRDDPGLTLAGPAAFGRASPAFDGRDRRRHELELPARRERWRAQCGCRVTGPAEVSQEWRAPLPRRSRTGCATRSRRLRARRRDVLRDPGRPRSLVACLLEPERTSTSHAEAGRPLAPAAAVRARRALEMSRKPLHADELRLVLR